MIAEGCTFGEAMAQHAIYDGIDVSSSGELTAYFVLKGSKRDHASYYVDVIHGVQSDSVLVSIEEGRNK